MSVVRRTGPSYNQTELRPRLGAGFQRCFFCLGHPAIRPGSQLGLFLSRITSGFTNSVVEVVTASETEQ